MTRVFAAPSKYVQGREALARVGEYCSSLGSTAVVLADDEVDGVLGRDLRASFEDTGCSVERIRFRGECSRAAIAAASERAASVGADVVVGAGGGKAIDTAKAVADRIDGAMVSLPTIASTDAPTSSLSILYTDDGTVDEALAGSHPDLVVVDTAVVAGAPTRWFRSGVGDALATGFEAERVREVGAETPLGTRPTYAGTELASACTRILRDHAPSAVRAVEADAVTESLEATVEAILLLSGLGFENGGLAAAHGIHDGLAATSVDATHGEKVCVGLIAGAVLEGRATAVVTDLAEFAERVGLPRSCSELGVTDREVLDTVAEAACHDGSPIHNEPFDVTPASVRDALVAADELVASR